MARTYRLDELRPGTPFRLVGPGIDEVAELVECDDCTAKVRMTTQPRVVRLKARDGTERTFAARRSQMCYWAPATCVEPLFDCPEGELEMKTSEVEIGGTYMAKVSNEVVPVRIDGANRLGGWDATNTKTGRGVRIKSPRRLRGKAMRRQRGPGGLGDKNANGAAEAGQAGEREGVAPRSQMDLGETKRLEAARKNKAAKDSAPPHVEKKVSALDAAAKVLADAKNPMNTKEMIEAMGAKGLWKSPGGKTPDRTLYSALTREIGTKGKESRFKKADGGKFALAK